MSAPGPVKDLRSALDRLVSKGEAVLRRRRISTARSTGFARCLIWCMTIPALFALYALGRRIGIFGGPSIGTEVVVACTLGVALLVWLETIADAASADVDPRDALGVIDQELGLADRLLTAASFRAKRSRTAFMEAAIEDARVAAAQALAADVPSRSTPFRLPADPGRWPLLGLALVLVAFWVDPGPRLPVEVRTVEVAEVDPEDAATVTRGADPEVLPPPTQVPVKTARKTPTKKGQEETHPDDSASELPEQSKETQGTTGSGESSPAADATGASQSKGMPSGEGQTSEPGKKKRKKKTKKKKPSKKPDDDDQSKSKERPQEKSGSTAGTGTASGSNKNPAASEWSSKDQVTDTEDDPVENDEDVDDEDSESEARGGAQPTLRDRKPPANRDLQIGFGNRPNPDANGRGGPSQMKKSRGTASLVLGVPIPDHIKGQANPGRTKITQERVDPKEDESSPVVGGARSPRQTPAGAIPSRDLAPWMRTLIRAYFLSIHPNDKLPSTDTPKKEAQ